jgi:ABC-type oligopeptide transport system ATPase subunit
MPVISVQNVTKTYQMGNVRVHALQGVNLTVERGEMLSVMGPSGSGKSTMMNIIGCLDVPSGGRYMLEGEDVRSMNDNQLASIRQGKIGFVFQTYNLLQRATALANVEMPLMYGNGRNRRARSPRTAARIARRIVRIPRLPAQRTDRGDPRRQFVEIGLAQNDHTRLPQPGNLMAVIRWLESRQREARPRRGHPRDVVVVLHQHRDPVQRTAHRARRPLRVERVRLRPRPGIETDNRVERGARPVVGPDSCQVEVDEPARGDAAFQHRGLQIENGGFGHLEAGIVRGRCAGQEEQAGDERALYSDSATAPTNAGMSRLEYRMSARNPLITVHIHPSR